MIHTIMIGVVGFVYQLSNRKLGLSYKFAFFGREGNLIQLIDCTKLDYWDWQHVDTYFGDGVAFILIWKNSDRDFNLSEAQFLLDFIKQDQDPLIYDDTESKRRSSLAAEIVDGGYLLVSWPHMRPSAYLTSLASFETKNRGML